jgi:hypothetical protein
LACSWAHDLTQRYLACVLAGIGRHPIAAAAAVVALVFAVPVVAWLLLVRGLTADDKPERDAALVMAHRLVTGRESLGTDVESPDRYVFRLVHQAAADGGVTGTELATHIGVAVCLRDGRATQAARFSYLHFSPSCTAGRLDLRPVETSIATDRARWRGDFAQGADAQDEPTPRVIGGP